jgi:hypothetical protein
MAKLSTTSVFGDLLVDGMIHGNVTGNLTGNASTATSATTASKADILTTARNIALGGILTGSASFNGSANITINASVAKPPKSGDWFSGGIPTVNTDGVMEVGKYIDFHNTDASTNDYDVRLQANTSTPCVITLPSGGGTLARTSDNVASATKLQTPRTINGTNFDGSANITTANWGTARTLTIGNKGQSVNGSGNITWSTGDILGNATILGKTSDWNTANATGIYEASGFNEEGATGANRPVGAYSWGGLLTLRHKNVTNQIYLSHGSNQMWIRGGWNGSFNTSWARVYTTDHKPTYSDVGAAAESHGTHVTWSTTTPKANGTAAVGSETKVARGDHVHPVQTSVSGNAGTATKLQTAREIKIGNKSNTFDGSANITYTLADIGAATSGHTHNYAGSSSAGGAANSAVKLSSARTINGTNFDGSANITTANWGTARKINQISVNGSQDYKIPLDYYTCAIGNKNDYPYHHIMTTGQCTGSWTDKSITIYIINHYNSSGMGIAKCTLRTNDAANGATASGEIKWLVRSGFNEDALCFNIRNTAKDAYMDVFYKAPGTYAGLTWYVLSEGVRGSHSSQWTKQNTKVTDNNGEKNNVYNETGMKALRTYTATLQSAVDSGHVNTAKSANSCSGNAATATKLATARTLTIGNTGKSFDGSGNQSWSLSEIGAAAEGHTHSSVASANVLNQNTKMDYGWSGLNYFNINGTAGNAAKVNDTPTTAWWHIIRCNHANSTGYYTDIAVPFNATSMYYKRITGGSVQNNGWVKMLDALNWSDYAAAKDHGTHVTYATATPKAHGTAAVGTSAKVAREDHVHPLQASAATWTTARTLTIGNKGQSVNGSGNVSWSLADIGAVETVAWDTSIKCATWSRLFQYSAANEVIGGAFLVNIQATRGNVVYGPTVLVNFGHASTCNIVQINNISYSNIKIRGVVDNNGAGYLEIYDNINSATNSTTQSVTVSVTKLTKGLSITKYTAFTSGATIPTNYASKGEITTVSGCYYTGKAATSGNADTATKLKTARTITLKGAITGSGSFDGNDNLEITTTRAPYFGGEGTSGSSGYIAFAQLKITGTYANRPLEFKLICRGKQTPCYVQVQFANTNNTDPGLSSLKYWGTDYGVFAHKTGAGTWLLYHTKSEAYDKVEVVDVNISNQGITITYPGSFITTKPTANVTDASLGGSIGSASTATSATKLATARDIKIGNATKSFNGTANVEFTLAEIGIGSSISAVASNLSGVTINGYDSMMTTINSNLGNL